MMGVGRQRGARRPHDGGRLLLLHPLSRHDGRPGGADRQHRQPDHRGVRRPGAHPGDPQRGRPRTPTRPPARRCRRVVGTVELRDVWFEYQPGAPVLKDVSFVAQPGHLDGAGRPLGLRQEHPDRPDRRLPPPDRGRRSWSTARTSRACGSTTTARQLGVVFQDNFLFDGTVLENIAYARPARLGRGGAARRRDRALRRLRAQAAGRLRHDRGRARRQALGRRAPAGGDRARDPRRSAHPDPRRGHLVARQRERGRRSRRASPS